MTNSSLICYTKLSPNCSPRTHVIDTITIHHMAGSATIEFCGEIFAPPSRQASSNYGIGSDGRIAMYVEEKNRSWCTSSSANDNRAVTIEVANCGGAPDWPVSDRALASLIELVTDICKRNNIKQLNFTGNLTGNMTVHRWVTPTNCPGDYLYNLHPKIAAEVNRRLNQKDKEDEPMQEPIYSKIEDVPAWARPTVEKLVDAGALQGDDSGLNLPYSMLRMFVIHDRMGIYDRL